MEREATTLIKDTYLKKDNTLHFCTLFETNYMSRGVALYNSLLSHCEDFKLYIFAFNDQSYELLTKLNLEHAIIISLQEFENKDLLSVKADRSVGEYCWTCTSSTIKYCIEKYNLDHCTYLDADLFFFSSPKALIEEVQNDSILITEHRYTPKYDQSEVSGKYCVQFMYFKKDELGMKCLNWWVDACIDWCYAIPEDGKFGDQKYLDDWTTRFKGVHELKHLGGGIAPWNVQQYDFKVENGKLRGKEKRSNQEFDAVFFHFHDVKVYDNGSVDFGNYTLSKAAIEHIYKPYLRALKEAKEMIQNVDQSIDPHGTRPVDRTIKSKLKGVKRRLEKNYNIYPSNL